MTQEPLIHTTKGNLPAASLAYETSWEVQPGYIKFSERHRLNGEVVRESVHIYDREGLQAASAAQGF